MLVCKQLLYSLHGGHHHHHTLRGRRTLFARRLPRLLAWDRPALTSPPLDHHLNCNAHVTVKAQPTGFVGYLATPQ